jgi:hypothetical protein
MALCRQSHQPFLVFAQSQPLVKETIDLSLQLTGRPIVLDRLDLVEGSDLRLIDAKEVAIKRPG